MVNQDVIAAKLAELADRVDRVRSRCPASSAELGANRDAVDLVAFNLMLAVQSAADIASHIISDEGWPAAPTLGHAFRRLHEHAVLSAPVADAMSRAVGLRNLVAHGYAGIDVGALHRAATSGVGDLGAFAREIGAWARAAMPSS